MTCGRSSSRHPPFPIEGAHSVFLLDVALRGLQNIAVLATVDQITRCDDTVEDGVRCERLRVVHAADVEILANFLVHVEQLARRLCVPVITIPI